MTPIIVDADEHPRPDTTVEQLGKLKGVNGPDLSVTAGNASGVNDGAAALLVLSEEAAKKQGLNPKARVVAMAAAVSSRASWASARRRPGRCWPAPD